MDAEALQGFGPPYREDGMQIQATGTQVFRMRLTALRNGRGRTRAASTRNR